MNQVFPEQPLTMGRAYPAPATLADILAQVFPTLHAQKTVYGPPPGGEIEGVETGTLPITMHEPAEMPNLPADHMILEPRADWWAFCKFRGVREDPLDFYGCVDRDGFWFNSSHGFGVAVGHCAAHSAPDNDFNPAEEIGWMREAGRKLGLSIIHGSMIKRMYEAELIS